MAVDSKKIGGDVTYTSPLDGSEIHSYYTAPRGGAPAPPILMLRGVAGPNEGYIEIAGRRPRHRPVQAIGTISSLPVFGGLHQCPDELIGTHDQEDHARSMGAAYRNASALRLSPRDAVVAGGGQRERKLITRRITSS